MTPAHAPYGYCPRCGHPGESRERRPNGDDRCEDGNPCLVMSPMPADELADAIERGEHHREEEP